MYSQHFKNQVDFLHECINGLEWSGNLIYKIIGGDIDSPSELKILIEGLYLMHIGTAGRTDMKMDDESAIDLYERYPSLMEGESRLGFVHSHHTMGTTFSNTDDEELQDNTEAYNIYLSVIVNYRGSYSARIAFITETTKTISYSFKNLLNVFLNKETQEEQKKMICYYEADVHPAYDVDDWFAERYDKILADSKKVTTPTYSNNNYNYNYNHGYGYGYGYNGINKKSHINPHVHVRKFHESDYKRFIIKMVTQDSSCISFTLDTLIPYKETYPLGDAMFLENLETCMRVTVTPYEFSKMEYTDRLEFLEEVIEYIEKQDLILENEGVNTLYNFLFGLVIEDAYNDKII